MINDASTMPRRPVVAFCVACLSVGGWLAAIPLVSEDSTPATLVYAVVASASGAAFVYGVIGVGDAWRVRHRLGVAAGVVGAALAFIVCFMSLFVISVIRDGDAWVGD